MKHIRMCVRACVRMCACTHVCACVHARACVRACVRMCVCAALLKRNVSGEYHPYVHTTLLLLQYQNEFVSLGYIVVSWVVECVLYSVNVPYLVTMSALLALLINN